ncbi:MAG TPA: T9SS type A sorting domain-containing protein [Bacteroidales bacterium]|nr:T9SS type A sorting domain-containing protein [Bacteroidales bacterium]
MKKLILFAFSIFLFGGLMAQFDVTMNVDMNGVEGFDPATHDVYVTGSLWDWPEPGSNADLKLTPTAEDPMIYTITAEVAEAMEIQYKYFIVIDGAPSWDNGEWAGDPNRMVTISGDVTIMDSWGIIVVETMIADFEDGTAGPLTLHVMGSGEWDNDELHPVSETFEVVDNPDASGLNESSKVMKFTRRGLDDGGASHGGFWANVDPAFDVTTFKYVHVMVWKERISPLKFKLEGGPSGTLEILSSNEQAETSMWVDIVFPFDEMTGAYPVIAFMPDFEDPLTMAENQVIYFDNIRINSDPNPAEHTPITPPMIIDFEDGTAGPLTLHVMGNGEWDNDELHSVSETFEVVDNPDPSGLNWSSKVMKFTRRGLDDGGEAHGGFWANVEPALDVTTYKYVHVMVWKERISPLKFKLEGGSSGTLEILSSNEQAETSKWVDIVFNFDEMTGAYPVIAFMPDFEDPLTMAENQVIYFDNIRINSDPNPADNTSIFTPKANISLAVYPNPVTSSLYIDLENDAQSISIYNLFGQQQAIFTNVSAGTFSFPTSELSNGVYMVIMRDNNNKQYTAKFVK